MTISLCLSDERDAYAWHLTRCVWLLRRAEVDAADPDRRQAYAVGQQALQERILELGEVEEATTEAAE